MKHRERLWHPIRDLALWFHGSCTDGGLVLIVLGLDRLGFTGLAALFPEDANLPCVG